MATIDIFSKRKKREESGGVPDVYRYDVIPEALRVQVVHLWRDAFGDYEDGYGTAFETYKAVHDILCREYGVFRLVGDDFGRANYEELCADFLLKCGTENALDIIELMFRVLWKQARANQLPSRLTQRSVSALLSELNGRFREHAVGYQFESGLIIRVDSALVHAEVVKPALHLLSAEGFQGADEEFRSAYEHYRHGKYKESLVDALKAFESTMKTICKRKAWDAPDGAAARQLVGILFDKELIPAPMAAHFGALRTTLEAGVPTLRNKMGGHGQGEAPVDVPDYLAAYALHLTAANIVMLVEAFKAKK
jgi:hypothetical protein